MFCHKSNSRPVVIARAIGMALVGVLVLAVAGASASAVGAADASADEHACKDDSGALCTSPNLSGCDIWGKGTCTRCDYNIAVATCDADGIACFYTVDVGGCGNKQEGDCSGWWPLTTCTNLVTLEESCDRLECLYP